MGPGPATVLSAAALAGATSTVILHPLEVVRSRMTCDTVGCYSHGIVAAFSTIIKKEGPLVLYTGLGSSLAAIMPEAAITYGERSTLCCGKVTVYQFPSCRELSGSLCFALQTCVPYCLCRLFYVIFLQTSNLCQVCTEECGVHFAGLFDMLTKAYMRSADKEKPGVGIAVAAGVASCCLGQAMSFPLETVSRRLQVSTQSPCCILLSKVDAKLSMIVETSSRFMVFCIFCSCAANTVSTCHCYALQYTLSVPSSAVSCVRMSLRFHR